MSSYSYRSVGTKVNQKEFPVLTESEPPSFPRPSSSLARSRLKNRLVLSKVSVNGRDSKLPNPPEKDQDEEFRHQIDRVPDRSRLDVTASDIQHPNQRPADSQYSVRFGSTDVVESFGWSHADDNPSSQLQSTDPRIAHLHSKIIESHSLYVPGYESTVPRLSIVQQKDNMDDYDDNDSRSIVLTAAYGKSFRNNDMEDAVQLILSGKKEFCYLEEVDPDDCYRLVLSLDNVSKDNQQGRYITLSANGVVRYCGGVIDQVSLREYLREYKYYYQLRNISVFGQYRKWKSFLILKEHALATRRRKRMAYLCPHLFILDRSFQAMLLFVNSSAIKLYDRESVRLAKVLFKITSTNFFEIQDGLVQNKSSVPKQGMEVIDKTDVMKTLPTDISSSPSKARPSILEDVCRDMTKTEVLKSIVHCIYLNVSGQFENVSSDIIPVSVAASKFRHKVTCSLLTSVSTRNNSNSYFVQSSIDMIASREAERAKSYVFEKAAKKKVQEKARQSALKHENAGEVVPRLRIAETASDDNLSYTQRSAHRLTCRRIANAVRLVDFVVRDYLYLSAESSLRVFLNKMNTLQKDDSINGRIGVKMVIRDLRRNSSVKNNDDSDDEDDVDLNLLSCYGIDGEAPPPQEGDLKLELYPNTGKALAKLRELITEIFNACRHEESLIHHEELKGILRPIESELADCSIIDLIFYDDRNSIHELSNSIGYVLEQDMTRCEKSLKKFAFLLETYCRTANETMKLNVEVLRKISIAGIKKKFHSILMEQESIRNLPVTINIGVTVLSVDEAAQTVLHKVHENLQLHFSLVPELYIVMGEQLFQAVHSVKVVLTRKFDSVQKFVEAIEVFNKAMEDKPKIVETYEYLIGLKAIMEMHSIPSSDEMYGIERTLKTEYLNYQDSIDIFEDNMENLSKHFQKELLSRSKSIIAPIEEIELSLSSEMFSSINSNADTTLEYIAELQTKFEEACNESAYLVKCQDLMKVFVFDGLHPDRIHQLITSNMTLWKAVKVLRNLLNYIMSTHFKEIDCFAVKQKVNAISKALLKLENQDQTSINAWVDESVYFLNNLLPIVEHLQVESYTPDEMAEIESLLGCRIYSNDEEMICSGQALVDLNVMKSATAIDAIHHRNACECNLRKKLSEMQSELNKKEVITVQDRNITYRITNLTECSSFLENLVLTAKVCLQSHYVQIVKDEFLLFYERVQEYDQLVQWIKIFQTEGLRLRAFYTNPKTTRHVHQGFKHFNIVDESWRSLIKVARSDHLLLSLLSSSRLKNLELVNNALSTAYDVVYAYIESQRVNCPRLYFISDTQCFDMFSNTDIKSVFKVSADALFPNLDSIAVTEDGDNVFVEGVESATEVIRFKNSCPLKIVLGDWINDIDATLTEHMIEDIRVLASEERSIIEDARYPICSSQAKIVGLETKFWASLKESFRSPDKKVQSELQIALKDAVLDSVVLLGTISRMSKDYYQVQSIADMILCLMQQRDVLFKAFGENIGNNTTEEFKHFHENAFFLECALQKFYDHKTSEVSVHHFATEVIYGYKYIGFSRNNSLLATPLAEKCYLSISATFHKNCRQIPYLRGSSYGLQYETLLNVTSAFGKELFPVNCKLFENNSVEATIKRCIIGTISGKFHTCFTGIEALSQSGYAFLVNSLAATMAHLGEQRTERTTASKFDLVHTLRSCQRPHFSACLNIPHVSDAVYFPASIRKKFRPLHIVSPEFSEILGIVLETFGFENPQEAGIRLSGFMKHVSILCALDHGILLRNLIRVVVPIVGSSLVKDDSTDMSQQCYMVVREVFKLIPAHLQIYFNSRIIEHACSLFLDFEIDPEVHASDFHEEKKGSACETLLAAIRKESSVIIVGPVGCGKTTIIREAIGCQEGYESEPRFNGTSAKSYQSTENNHFEMESKGSTIAAPKLMHDFGLNYPRKLFRHSINPVLLENSGTASKAHLHDVAWSGLSTYDSQSATDDMIRATIAMLSKRTETADEEVKRICNKRHFDSLDRLLYDISQMQDIRFLHMEVTTSAALSHFINRISHYCPNKYSPSMVSMGYKLIWECPEISDIDPGLVSSVPLIVVPDSNYSYDDTLATQMNGFINKFDYVPSPKELVEGLTTPLMPCLVSCVNIFVRPFLDLTIFESLNSVQSLHVVIRNFFKVAAAMYKYGGLDVTTVVHPLKVTVIYDNIHKENSIVEKQLWSKASFYSIMAFACIWSFGNCSPHAPDAFEAVYKTIADNLLQEVRTWGKGNSTDVINEILPPTDLDGEECFPCNEYCLHRIDNEEVDLTWVHWKHFARIDTAGNMPGGNQFCTVKNYFRQSVYVPTRLSAISILIKDALLCTEPESTQSCSTLALLGNAGVGKSSILFMLADSMKGGEWKGVIDDGPPQKIQDAIRIAQDSCRVHFMENNLPIVGGLFIDDVNLDGEASEESRYCGADFYHSLMKNEHYYDCTHRKWKSLENAFIAITGTLCQKKLNQRILQHSIAFSIPHNEDVDADIFCAKFMAMCPHVREDIAFDIANISLKVFERLRAATPANTPFITLVPASHHVRHFFDEIETVFEKVSVASTIEVCKIWKQLLGSCMSGSSIENIFSVMLNKLLDDSSLHKSNIKGVIYKGQGDSGRATQRASILDKTEVTRGRSRASFRPTLNGVILKDNVLGSPIDTEEEQGSHQNFFLISPEEMMTSHLDSIQHIVLENFQELDFENLMFWKDTQNCMKFLSVRNSPLALIWGPTKRIANIVLEAACNLTENNFIPCTLNECDDLKTFTLQYVHSFCVYLTENCQHDVKLPSKFFEVVQHECERILYGEGYRMFPSSKSNVWHIHLNGLNMDVSARFWTQFFSVFQFKASNVQDLLRNVYDLSFNKTSKLHRYISQFVGTIKIIFSFGESIEAGVALHGLSHVPKMCHELRNIYCSNRYGMNYSLLLNSLDADVAECFTRSIMSIVKKAVAHESLENSFFLEQITNADYEEGTYAMISSMFQLTIDPSSATTWDGYSKEFSKIYSLVRGQQESNRRSDAHEERSCVMSTDYFEALVPSEEKLITKKDKLCNIVWVCVMVRYFSFCSKLNKEKWKRAIFSHMKELDLIPTTTNISMIAYTYMHTLADSRHIDMPEKFKRIADTLLLFGECIGESRYDLSAIVLSLLQGGHVRVVGSACHSLHLLAHVCDISAQERILKVQNCDSYDWEEFMTVSEDRSKIFLCQDKTKNQTHMISETIISMRGLNAKLDDITPRTTVIEVDLHQTQFFVDCYVLYLSVKGFESNSLLSESFHYFCGISNSLHSSYDCNGLDDKLSKLNIDFDACRRYHEALRYEWMNAVGNITRVCQGILALSSSVASYHPLYCNRASSLLLGLMSGLNFADSISPFQISLQDILTKFYESLSEQFNEYRMLVLEFNMIVLLTEHDQRICHGISKQIFNALLKKQGMLGLHSSPAHNDDIIPTDSSFDVILLAMEYISQVKASCEPQQPIGADALNKIFLDHSESFEEWANMYNVDHRFPLTNDTCKMSHVEKMVIVLTVKPIFLGRTLSDFIFNCTGWRSPSPDVSNGIIPSELHNEPVGKFLINFYENETGILDTASKDKVPCYLSDTILRNMDKIVDEGSYKSWGEKYFIYCPKMGRPLNEIFNHVHETASESGVLTLECMSIANFTIGSEKAWPSTVMKSKRALSLMWYNFTPLLRSCAESLLRIHFDCTSNISNMKVAIPRVLIRAYWLLAIFHTAVVIRLSSFQISVGDDLLVVACRLVMQLRLRSVHEPELLFSRIEILIDQVYHQVYDIISDSVYVKNLCRALFDNVFTENSIDADNEYYLLGLLPLPNDFNTSAIEKFVKDIGAVLNGGDYIHIADFIGCTNGELYETDIHNLCRAAACFADSSSTGDKQMSARNCEYVLGTSRMFSDVQLSHFSISRPSLRNHHHRVVTALSFLLEQLPSPIDYEEDYSKLTCSHRKVTDQKRLHGGGDTDNHLWKYLLLEIESFNASLCAFEKTLTLMMDVELCPASVVDVVQELEDGVVPSSWLKYSFDENINTRVPLQKWIRQLIVRRKMLNVWQSQRYPEYIYLHLLQNPEGLLYALKQSYAVSQARNYEDVFIDARILTLPYTSMERHNEIAKINFGNHKAGAQSYNIVIAGAHIMNARWVEEQYNLEFLNPSFASKFSQELYLKVSATCEDCFDEDDYQCPVYTACDLPTADSIISGNKSVLRSSDLSHRRPLFHVSTPSQCSVIEWKKRNVTIHASPDWHVPLV